MKHLKACVWVGPSKNKVNSQSKCSQIKPCLPENSTGDISDALGVWTIFSSVSEAITFAYAVLSPKREKRMLGVDYGWRTTFEEQEWFGWTLDTHKSLTPFLEPRQIWFTETLFNFIDVEPLSWEEVGVTSTERGEIRCFRLLSPGQVLVPSAFKRSIREQKVIVCQKHRSMGPVEKGKHVVFVGFKYGAELEAQVTRVSSVIPNDRLWLVVPKIESSRLEKSGWTWGDI